jgi:AhpD family alkylhydroperoxidase
MQKQSLSGFTSVPARIKELARLKVAALNECDT